MHINVQLQAFSILCYLLLFIQLCQQFARCFSSDHYLLLMPFIVGHSHLNQHGKQPRLFTQLRSLKSSFSRLLFAHHRENFPFLPEIFTSLSDSA